MKIIEIASKILLAILVVGTVTSLFIGGFMPIFSIAFGMLLLYYTLVYLLIKFLKKNWLNTTIVGLLFIFPILWAIIDGEGFINILLEGVHLDMK